MNGWMDGWMDGWTDGWMDGWMDGWIDGWIDRQIDRQIDRCRYMYIKSTKSYIIFSQPFRIALNFFPTVKSLNSATALTKN